MFKRTNTKQINVGNKILGGQNKVLIQTMLDCKTSNIDEVVKKIKKLEILNVDIIRVSILDKADAEAIKEIKKYTSTPIVGDFQFVANLVEETINNGIDKIRINPVNTPKNQLIKIIDICNKKNIPIRIGLNEGSISKNGKPINSIKGLIDLTLDTINFFEENYFTNLCISVKSSDPFKTIKIYEKLAKVQPYPLHIGVTESGFEDIGIIRSTIALSDLLRKGIGDTIRISLTKNPELEVVTAKRLLHDLNLFDDYPTIVSCPTCGRCKVKNLDTIAKNITSFMEENHYNLKISIMGCIVNGIGEAKHSDIGVAGEDGEFLIFRKGKILKKVHEKDLLYELKNIIKDIN